MYVTVYVTVYVIVYVPDYVTGIRVLGSGTNEESSPRSGSGQPPIYLHDPKSQRELLIALTPRVL